MCRSPGNGRGVSRRNVSLKLFELSFEKRLGEKQITFMSLCGDINLKFCLSKRYFPSGVPQYIHVTPK